jgi:hypothetical protein
MCEKTAFMNKDEATALVGTASIKGFVTFARRYSVEEVSIFYGCQAKTTV